LRTVPHLNFNLQFLHNIPQLCYPILVKQDLVNWKLYQLYTPTVQRSAWRWPCTWAETCSCNYNL